MFLGIMKFNGGAFEDNGAGTFRCLTDAGAAIDTRAATGTHLKAGGSRAPAGADVATDTGAEPVLSGFPSTWSDGRIRLIHGLPENGKNNGSRDGPDRRAPDHHGGERLDRDRRGRDRHGRDRHGRDRQASISVLGHVAIVFEGRIYNMPDLLERVGGVRGSPPDGAGAGETLIRLYEKYGELFPGRINGKFSFALWDSRAGKLVLGRDHLGIEPLYYAENCGSVVFGNSLHALTRTGLVKKEISSEAMLQYLLYCYNPSDQTLVDNVFKLRPGHVLCQYGPARSIKPYWRLSFANQPVRTEDEYREEILPLIEDAIRIRLEPEEAPGIFLSGGTDSSTLVSLASKILDRPFRTFSFRCMGKSFDESGYARLVANRFGAMHNEVIYGADQLSLISEAVRFMDEPFCDVGIEVGTYVLGRAASGKVAYTLSGEGGDELFGGHPVYVADKVASVVDHVPSNLVTPFTSMFTKLPDSDRKKDLSVLLKRFSYGLSFPSKLLSHRWRIYYTPDELRSLCSEERTRRQCRPERLFEPMLRHNEGADGRDILSRSLYSEYSTLVDFYLRRLSLLKSFSIDPRTPLMDIRLVEYAARVPSALKIKGLSNTKYIYRKVLEGILPREILYDRPKLGHSVPMKNWIRDDPKALGMIRDVLDESRLVGAGVLDRAYIDRIVREHVEKQNNHSHRLWGLTVLDLWLREHMRP